jgi:hypothetical protein
MLNAISWKILNKFQTINDLFPEIYILAQLRNNHNSSLIIIILKLSIYGCSKCPSRNPTRDYKTIPYTVMCSCTENKNFNSNVIFLLVFLKSTVCEH